MAENYMLKTIKQKIKATLLIVFSFLPFVRFIQYLNWISASYEDGSFIFAPSLTFSILRTIDRNRLSLYVLYIFLFLVALIIIWSSNYLGKKLMQIITKILNGLYFLLFSYTMVLFLKSEVEIVLIITKNLDPTNPPPLFVKPMIILVLLFILFSYIESIWKFSKKIFSRKYFNALYFLFSSISWWLSLNVSRGEIDYELVSMESLGISLIIAAAEFARRRSKSKPESNSVLPEQAMEQ